MKKLLFAAMGLAVVFASSCKKDAVLSEDKTIIPGPTLDTLVGIVTGTETLTRNTYLKGIVLVSSGATLVVNPGVTIFGSLGSGTPNLDDLPVNKGTLVVQRGGRLVANGSAAQPIVWTSVNAAGSRNFGDWGGIVVLGNAPAIVSNGNNGRVYEAFGLTDTRFSYGGTNSSDNSGTIRYNRIEFGGGIVIAANAEVNGLTLAGVGSGTTVDYVEVANNGDDGFEWFGGTVNAKHLLSFNNKDDDFDFDEAYTGNLQFLIAYRIDLADNSGSEFVELDNNSLAATFPASPIRTKPFIANATFVGPTGGPRAGLPSNSRFDGGVYIRRNGRIILVNSLIIGQALPSVFDVTPTTRPNLGTVNGALNFDSSFVAYNIFQANNLSNAVVFDDDEGNPLPFSTGTPLDNTFNDPTPVINYLGGLSNTALTSFASFNLNAALVPNPGSPAASGGINLAAVGLTFFTGTTQRGGVITTDQWTTTGWLTTAIN